MVKVKICGLKDEANVRAAVAHGADFLGFVFFEKSPRNISIKDAKKLSDFACGLNSKIQICAVTVNPNDDLLLALKNGFAPDYIQLHGNEDLKRIAQIKAMGHKIIKAIGVSNAQDIEQAKSFFEIADFVLFDAKPPKNSQNAGGFGVKFDWDLLKNLNNNANWILSGGLNPLNVNDAIAATNASFVDVSSGVEGALGIKEAHLIAEFIKQAKV